MRKRCTARTWPVWSRHAFAYQDLRRRHRIGSRLLLHHSGLRHQRSEWRWRWRRRRRELRSGPVVRRHVGGEVPGLAESILLQRTSRVQFGYRVRSAPRVRKRLPHAAYGHVHLHLQGPIAHRIHRYARCARCVLEDHALGRHRDPFGLRVALARNVARVSDSRASQRLYLEWCEKNGKPARVATYL